MELPVSPGCPANRAKRALRLVTRTRTVNPRIIRHILFGVASSLAITQRRWHALLAGTRGIEPPFSPLAALTSNEWLALRYTRSRRAFPCNARLSGLPNGDNCLLIDRYNRNDAMQLVGLRSGPPKTHPSVQCRAAICTTRVWESNPRAWGIEPRFIPPRLQAFALCPRSIGAACRNRTGSSSPYGALPSGSGLHHTTTPHMRPSFRAVIGCRRAPHITENMARVPWYARFFSQKRSTRKEKKTPVFRCPRIGTASRR